MPKAKFHFINDYRRLVRQLIASHPLDEAMAMAVGGQFEHLGRLEHALLMQAGLKAHHRLVDVGCGSGRLAIALGNFLAPHGGYLGTDVVQELLDYAKSKCPPSWEFKMVEELRIPAGDSTADFVCFFSVLTHLLQHESYIYLLEARRVLKPGGRIVFSWLQYPQNWTVFEATYKTVLEGREVAHLNEFLSVAAIKTWANHLGMSVVQMHNAKDPFVNLDGKFFPLGQAVCVLAKDP